MTEKHIATPCRLREAQLAEVISWAETECAAFDKFPHSEKDAKTSYLWMLCKAILDLRDKLAANSCDGKQQTLVSAQELVPEAPGLPWTGDVQGRRPASCADSFTHSAKVTRVEDDLHSFTMREAIKDGLPPDTRLVHWSDAVSLRMALIRAQSASALEEARDLANRQTLNANYWKSRADHLEQQRNLITPSASAARNAAASASENVKPGTALPCASSADRNSRPDHGIGEQTGTNRATQASAAPATLPLHERLRPIVEELRALDYTATATTLNGIANTLEMVYAPDSCVRPPK